MIPRHGRTIGFFFLCTAISRAGRLPIDIDINHACGGGSCSTELQVSVCNFEIRIPHRVHPYHQSRRAAAQHLVCARVLTQTDIVPSFKVQRLSFSSMTVDIDRMWQIYPLCEFGVSDLSWRVYPSYIRTRTLGPLKLFPDVVVSNASIRREVGPYTDATPPRHGRRLRIPAFTPMRLNYYCKGLSLALSNGVMGFQFPCNNMFRHN